MIDAMRLPGGLYIDALSLGGASDKPAALNANGVGLISLCIADSMYKKTGDKTGMPMPRQKLCKPLKSGLG